MTRERESEPPALTSETRQTAETAKSRRPGGFAGQPVSCFFGGFVRNGISDWMFHGHGLAPVASVSACVYCVIVGFVQRLTDIPMRLMLCDANHLDHQRARVATVDRGLIKI